MEGKEKNHQYTTMHNTVTFCFADHYHIYPLCAPTRPSCNPGVSVFQCFTPSQNCLMDAGYFKIRSFRHKDQENNHDLPRHLLLMGIFPFSPIWGSGTSIKGPLTPGEMTSASGVGKQSFHHKRTRLSPAPLACTTLSGILSRSKWAISSVKTTSWTSRGPRGPAVMRFNLSPTGLPAPVVRTSGFYKVRHKKNAQESAQTLNM